MDTTNMLWWNGEYDPWQAGGITRNISSTSTAIFTPRAAHHYDLMMPHVNDTVEITQAREIEAMTLSNWMANFRMNIM